ncbi:DUF4417 domain-containing protein [Archangium violaceum]|nr:DUF4417 domain-containing protein [Archangium violaceum]
MSTSTPAGPSTTASTPIPSPGPGLAPRCTCGWTATCPDYVEKLVGHSTRDDWGFWETLLREQSSIRFVCKEFQTGLHRYEVGVRALWRINDLQYRVRRKLHPILVGGARFTHVAARYFESFTVVDSTPFLKTAKRKRCVEMDGVRLRWEGQPLSARDTLETLLEYNHIAYAGVLQCRVDEAARFAAMERQLELPLVATLH